jgi:hypothetical protein
MKVYIYLWISLWLFLLSSHGAKRSLDARKLSFEITRIGKDAGLLHWKFVNNSEDGVFIYNFFLLGAAYNIERSPGRLVFDTCPITRVASCPPNSLW